MQGRKKKPPIIVVSSLVAQGAVGNRAAVFALERFGYPVIAVPTVVLAWHPGEGPATRIVPPVDAFAALVGDLIGSDRLATVGAILSGYLGEAGQADALAGLVAAVKAHNPAALYLCDPVIGDAAGPYVAPEITAAIRDRLLPLADILTPNRHELGFLRGEALADNDALARAASATGVGEVLVTSAFGAPLEAVNLLLAPHGRWRARHEAASVAPHGTGDLLAALYLAHRLAGAAAPEACGLAVGSTLRLVELAAGASALPLAEGQAAFFRPHDGVAVEVLR